MPFTSTFSIPRNEDSTHMYTEFLHMILFSWNKHETPIHDKNVQLHGISEFSTTQHEYDGGTN